MKYASIRSMDISNGEKIGISLFVQGCHFHCKDCFNQETWNFNGGKEWTREVQNQFLELAKRPFIQRISILGGEPLADENLNDVLQLLKQIRLLYGDSKSVWLYTGYEWEDLWNCPIGGMSPIGVNNFMRQQILKNVDILVDGRFEKDKLDLSLPYKGSANQRLINVKETLSQNKIVLWEV